LDEESGWPYPGQRLASEPSGNPVSLSGSYPGDLRHAPPSEGREGTPYVKVTELERVTHT
jgi:hypothetical protein